MHKVYAIMVVGILITTYFSDNFPILRLMNQQENLRIKINTAFGSLDSLKESLTKLATGQFGSGWAWLSTDISGNLSVSSSPNQDNPLLESEGKIYPILAIDVWEHAYYLKYKNLRADYIKAFFEVT